MPPERSTLACLLLLAGMSAAADEAVQARALLVPEHEAALAAPMAGRVLEITRREGEAFAKGELLVRFDCAVLEATQRRHRAELGAARRVLDARRRLYRLSSSSELELALAESEVEKAAAQLELVQAQLADCRIEAPYAGRVERREARAYEAVAAGQPLLRVLDDRAIEIRINAPSAWLRWLQPGAAFTVAIDETGATHAARLERLNARVDAASQTIELIARFTEARPAGLLAGMSGVARFTPP